jgi:hypothetical protein
MLGGAAKAGIDLEVEAAPVRRTHWSDAGIEAPRRRGLGVTPVLSSCGAGAQGDAGVELL